MATINFLYRSTKPEAFLNIRLLFRLNDNDFQIGGKSKIQVSKDYWKNHHGKTRFKDIDIKNQQTEVNNEISNFENYILDAFNNASPNEVSKEWLKNTVYLYYNPSVKLAEVPTELIKYFDVYIESKKDDIKESSIKKYRVIKSKLIRFEKHFNLTLKIEDVNEDFRIKFKEFCDLNQYSKNTRHRELVLIKTVCFNAKHNGINTSYQLEGLKFKREVVKHTYLNFTELDLIKNKTFDKDYLNNARDWLLISCFTAQRVSDFMKFTKEKIRIEDGEYYLDFKQQKTNKLTTIPVLKEVLEILNKRNGDFPRAISDQKYNDYIKEVCKQCGFDEIIKGKKRICIAQENVKPTKYDYRDVSGEFPKHELITSHIGRRSFASNYYGKVPTTYLIGITNHSTEKQFLNYIQKAEKDMAKDAHQYFN